jgi:hypothetical protein
MFKSVSKKKKQSRQYNYGPYCSGREEQASECIGKKTAEHHSDEQNPEADTRKGMRHHSPLQLTDGLDIIVTLQSSKGYRSHPS